MILSAANSKTRPGRLLPVLFVLFLSSLLNAQSLTTNRFENFTVKQGLPSHKVYYSLLDTKNFLWFATENGLSRYDGSRFTSFTHEGGVTGTIPEDIILFMLQISNDEIFLLTISGLPVIYDYRTGTFTDITKRQGWMKNQSISSLFKDSKGNYWLTTNTGLIKADLHFNFIKQYDIPDKVKGHHIPNRVNTICEDKYGRFWLGMFYRGVLLFDPAIEKYDTKRFESIIPHLQVRSIAGSKDGRYIFIATAGEGLFRFDVNNFSYRKWRFNENEKSGIPSDIISNLCIQDESVLWLGTLEGLSRFEIETGRISTFSNNPDKPLSLVNNMVEHILYDTAGILWVSTFGGISKLITLGNRFNKISVRPGPNSISSNKIVGVYSDESDNIWLATSGGIDIITAGTGKIVNYKLPKSFPFHENSEVVRFFKDSDGNFWVGTWGGGISRTRLPAGFEPGNSLRFTNFYYDSSDHNSISSNFIRSFAEDEEGNLWISTWNGGINKIEAGSKSSDKVRFIRYSAGPDSSRSLASNYTHEIVPDKRGNLWICTSRGVQRFNYSSNTFRMYFPAEAGDLINSSTHLYLDSTGTVWNSSFSGLVRISSDGEDYSAKIIYRDKFRGIYTLIMDRRGVLWFSTQNSEIGSYNPATQKLRFYSMLDEVDGCDFYSGFPALGRDGKVYFPSFSGLLYFDPSRLLENKTPPPVYVTGVTVSGEKFRGGSDVTLLRRIELDHDFGSLKINLASLNYIYSEQNEYRYLLEGYGKGWVELGNRAEIYLTGLAPGSYSLRIMGCNNDGVWNSEPVVLSIIISPPFYRNPYFVSIVIVFLIAAAGFFTRRKIRTLKAEKEQHLSFSEQLINSQEEERKRLSKELHDSLGQNLLVIKNLLYLYNTSEKKDENDLAQISELISESIDEVKEISSNLHPHQLERLGLIKALNSMINKVKKISGVSIRFEYDDITGQLPAETEINIYRIVQESLNNIVKHSRATEANVKLISSVSGILVTVEDNGKGIDTEDSEMNLRLTEGLGLKSMKERARLINAAFNFESSVKTGTRIRIELPAIKETKPSVPPTVN